MTTDAEIAAIEQRLQAVLAVWLPTMRSMYGCLDCEAVLRSTAPGGRCRRCGSPSTVNLVKAAKAE